MEQNFISTAALAKQGGWQPASIRTSYWRNGHFYGVVPCKLPGGKTARLLWPADTLARILAAGEVA
jgi:hypothetical protein